MVILSSWGFTGHEKIGEGTSKYFDPSMSQFHEWTVFLTEHSSDADKRKAQDESENIKHYIDIDNYSEFNKNGFISQNKDTLIARYGADFVNQQGSLPWTTFETFDSLVSCFTRLDFDKALLFAADLSHYVADGHMPLHITNNYDGEVTGNDGIHYRYETKMIGKYVDQIEVTGGDVFFIDDISEYVFDYLYASYPYVDSILIADNYARSINSNFSSTAYSKALWEKTKIFTIQQFENSSNSIANLIFTAWLTAGSPLFEDKLSGTNLKNSYFSISSIFVDHDEKQLKVEYQIERKMSVEFKIYDNDGKEEKMKYIASAEAGNHNFMIDVAGLSNGLYILEMNVNRQKLTMKFTI